MQLFSNLGTYLCGISIDCLSSSNNQIVMPHLLDGLCQGIRGGKCIGTCKGTVSKQNAIVGSTVQTFANDLSCSAWPHCQDGNSSTWHGILHPQRQFKCIEIFRIKNCRKCRPVYCSIGLHGILPNISGIRNLLRQYNYF